MEEIIIGEKTLKERAITFAWGLSGFLVPAVAAYLVNISDVREIDIWQVITLMVVVSSGYIINQWTYFLKNNK